jgi:hypothetical protein
MTEPMTLETAHKLTLIGDAGDGEQTACLMSARALLDGRGLTDSHPSECIRRLGIRINDTGRWWAGDEERTRVLLPVALDDRLCADRVDASPAAERKRAFLLADRACRLWAPRTLEAAALKGEAETLRQLPEVVDKDTARQAITAVRACRKTVDAAEADADAADAAAAAAYAAYAAADAAADAAEVADAAAYAADVAADVAAYAADVAAYAAAIRDEAIDLLLELCEVRA